MPGASSGVDEKSNLNGPSMQFLLHRISDRAPSSLTGHSAAHMCCVETCPFGGLVGARCARLCGRNDLERGAYKMEASDAGSLCLVGMKCYS